MVTSKIHLFLIHYMPKHLISSGTHTLYSFGAKIPKLENMINLEHVSCETVRQIIFTLTCILLRMALMVATFVSPSS